ncbi:GGDEF domain-containing protein [Photobacterium atrarenae]|uniref:diguanylate cyclase n=1 Tax=Photobacterium atrarenae TaxID=865757 RepID=A0ABY5GQD5_9GAMM|nr:GGDEF domain-containing protein [Photobacterium atrarenae]UTV31030.1 GGDEF domain-containing protein [Photobacterium atrarenae]
MKSYLIQPPEMDPLEKKQQDSAIQTLTNSGMIDGVGVFDFKYFVLRIRAQSSTRHDISRQSLLSGNKEVHLTPANTDEMKRHIQVMKAKNQTQLNGTIEFRAPNGNSVWLHCKGSLCFKANQFQGIAYDITDYKRQEQQLQRENEEYRLQAHQDDLTALYNRRGFFVQMDHKLPLGLSRGAGYSLAIIDVDAFKTINDQHGHQKGDHILSTIATTLQSYTRKSDIIGRLAGDEFIVLIDETNFTESLRIADRFRAAIEAQLTTMHAATVSIGISTLKATEVPSESDITSLRDQLIYQADMALYEAKRRGRNQTWHYHQPENGTGTSTLS